MVCELRHGTVGYRCPGAVDDIHQEAELSREHRFPGILVLVSLVLERRDLGPLATVSETASLPMPCGPSSSGWSDISASSLGRIPLHFIWVSASVFTLAGRASPSGVKPTYLGNIKGEVVPHQ